VRKIKIDGRVDRDLHRVEREIRDDRDHLGEDVGAAKARGNRDDFSHRRRRIGIAEPSHGRLVDHDARHRLLAVRRQSRQRTGDRCYPVQREIRRQHGDQIR
jgi:hypothetical protein